MHEPDAHRRTMISNTADDDDVHHDRPFRNDSVACELQSKAKARYHTYRRILKKVQDTQPGPDSSLAVCPYLLVNFPLMLVEVSTV